MASLRANRLRRGRTVSRPGAVAAVSPIVLPRSGLCLRARDPTAYPPRCPRARRGSRSGESPRRPAAQPAAGLRLLMMQARVVAVETRLHLAGNGLELGWDSRAGHGVALELGVEVVEGIGAVAPEPRRHPRRQLGLEGTRLPESSP